MKVGPWIFEENCAMRVLEGTDHTQIKNRVAFIEKTPRIRIRPFFEYGHPAGDWVNWASGFKGSGPTDPESMKWCDDALVLFGYEI